MVEEEFNWDEPPKHEVQEEGDSSPRKTRQNQPKPDLTVYMLLGEAVGYIETMAATSTYTNRPHGKTSKQGDAMRAWLEKVKKILPSA